MRDDVVEERIKQALEDARRAREAGDADARLRHLSGALDDALGLADPAVVANVAWRLAKARFDHGQHATTLDALEPLLATTWRERNLWGVREVVGPFDHYPKGLAALPALTRRVWDHEGYRHAALPPLWEAWIAAWQARGDAFSAAWGQVTFAWQQAATGAVDAVRDVTHRIGRLGPKDFADAPTHHPRADTAEGSAAWLQLDAARTLLRAATWAGRERVAWEASELLEDAAEDVALDRRADFWFLDALLQAAARFGWSDPVTRYGDALAAFADADPASRRHPPLAEAHRARARAWRAAIDGRSEACALFADAARALHADHAGPEWVVQAWLDAAGQPGAPPDALSRARAEAARTGVHTDRLKPPDGSAREA
ncbi:MAG: hypothetical protein H6733_05755 [Alphaproteobacteria bacterium]|nr:hypothetical protein [Alphaproteobacteria bacterium]